MCCSAFVCALWKESECPFRVMDEFDVYMVSYSPTHTHSGSGVAPSMADGGSIRFALIGIAQ